MSTKKVKVKIPVAVRSDGRWGSAGFSHDGFTKVAKLSEQEGQAKEAADPNPYGYSQDPDDLVIQIYYLEATLEVPAKLKPKKKRPKVTKKLKKKSPSTR